MDTKEKRAAFRKRVKDLSGKELVQWSFLVNLAQRIDNELAAYAVLFSDEDESDTDGAPFAANAQLAGIQLMLQQEITRHSAAQAQRQIKEGEEQHADHAQNGN